MDDVIKYAEGLKKQGKNVEIFSQTHPLKSNLFTKSEWGDIMEDWGNFKDKFPNGIIPDKVLPQTKMYQANEKWVKHLKSEGYDVYDIGNLRSLRGEGLKSGYESAFFEMEKLIIFE